MSVNAMAGVIVSLITIMFSWLFILHLKEKSLAVYRAKDMHDKMRTRDIEFEHKLLKVDERILELLELLRVMMPEQNVKDFVDREFKPVHKSLDSLQAGQTKNNEIVSNLATNIQVLVDRDKNKND